LGQRPLSDLDQHIGQPPQLAQAGILHPLRALCVLKPSTRRARSALRSPC
jgi:hypothetical protein